MLIDISRPSVDDRMTTSSSGQTSKFTFNIYAWGGWGSVPGIILELDLEQIICSIYLSKWKWKVAVKWGSISNRQGGGSFLAYQRYKAGTSTAFSAGLGDEDGGCPEGTYTAYDEENGGQYSEPPFSDGGGAGECSCCCSYLEGKETLLFGVEIHDLHQRVT